MDGYHARMPRNMGAHRKTIGLSLAPIAWHRLEDLASEKEWSVAMVVSQIVGRFLAEQMDREAKEAGYDAASMLTRYWRGGNGR